MQNGFILTSNRDEKIYRTTIDPAVYESNDIKLLYPKDEKAGGTWIVTRNDGTSIVLLNGAFVNHEKKANYRQSRGQILLEIIQAKYPLLYFNQMDLKDIEPFTLIIYQNNTLTDVKWDGNGKYQFDKLIHQPHIWSSSTLYSRKQKIIRQKWFDEFWRYNKPITMEKIFNFHTDTHLTNTEYGLLIDRKDLTKTVSISQIIVKNDLVEMNYFDRLNNIKITGITF